MATGRFNVSSLASRLDGHFGRCAALAAAGSGALALVGSESAEAAVVSSGPVNINIPSTTAGVYLNVVTGVSNASPASVPGWDLNPWSSTNLNMFNPAAPAGGVYVGTATAWNNLTVGAVVGPASTYGSGSPNVATPLNFNSSDNYVGFRFQNEANGNQTHYGWMRISLSGTASAQPRAIVEYAYESDAGVPITVPEPSSLGLLALGALGVLARRR